MHQEDINEPAPIKRRLRRVNSKTRETETIEEAAIAGLRGPIVILGDPGLGKSVLTRKLGSEGNNRYVRAGTFVRSTMPADSLPRLGGRLVIDGLDEVASSMVGGGVDAVLERLSTIGNPHFILSSREADWRGASARVRIEDDYNEAVSILHLEPFDRDDADLFLRSFFPDVDAGNLLDHLSARGLEEIYSNPLTLGMIGEIARAETTLPSARADLLERACTIMLREENQRHQDATHALRSNADLLSAAGAICASLLLCDRSGIYIGPTSETPDDFLHLSSIQGLPFAEAAAESRKTRLFQADGEGRFTASHRVIAEYLGARWLAICVDHTVSERRIRFLVTQAGGVPTSLRGLSAWLAHFSSALAPYCIAADPYAVLRYGNAETLPLEQARILLHALAKLSTEDPYFRAEDWSRHPATGLMRIELKDDILSLLSDERTHAHLVFLLLEAMVGNPIAELLARDLETVLYNPNRLFGARSRAAGVLIESDALLSAKSVIERLLGLGDSDSQRLAFELLIEVGLAIVPMHLAVEAILAYAGLTVSPLDRKQREHSIHVPRRLLVALSASQLQVFLDKFANYASTLMRDGNHWTKEQIADTARTAALIALQSGVPVTPNQVWHWLGWLHHYDGHDTEIRAALCHYFEKNVSLKRGIQATAMLTASTENLRSAAFGLGDVSAGLVLNDQDMVALIRHFGMQSDGKPNLSRLRKLVSVGRTRVGLAAEVKEAALKLVGENPAFLRYLTKLSKPFVNEYEKKRERILIDAETKRQKTYQKIREIHVANVDAIRAGDFRWLNPMAEVYFGHSREFSKEAVPEIRLEKLLGPVLTENALVGFMMALRRNDLPSAAEIAQSHAESREWFVEKVLICGIAEMVRHGSPLETVPRPALDSAYMAWRRQPESNIVGGVEIGPALEGIVLTDEANAESFFRTSIEPQLQARLEHVYDLYSLTHDQRWSALAGRLTVEWLIQNVSLPLGIEAELLDVAVRHGDRRRLNQLVAAGVSRVHASFEALMEWLATAFVLDFGHARPRLIETARDNRDFLWSIRRRISGGHHDIFVPLTIEQRAFVVEAFGSSWPQIARPEGSSMGDTNPWDARV